MYIASAFFGKNFEMSECCNNSTCYKVESYVFGKIKLVQKGAKCCAEGDIKREP